MTRFIIDNDENHMYENTVQIYVPKISLWPTQEWGLVGKVIETLIRLMTWAQSQRSRFLTLFLWWMEGHFINNYTLLNYVYFDMILILGLILIRGDLQSIVINTSIGNQI